jgi:hypothetical protein
MQMPRLGGWLSITTALIWAGTFLLPLTGIAALYGVSWCLMVGLSFPLGLLSGALSTSGPMSTPTAIAYALLMIPNCFIVGYTLSGLWRLAKLLINPSSTDCSVRTYPDNE